MGKELPQRDLSAEFNGLEMGSRVVNSHLNFDCLMVKLETGRSSRTF